MTPNERWEDDSIQFPRLLAELRTNFNFSRSLLVETADSMDLTMEQVEELLDRAEAAWEKIKERNDPYEGPRAAHAPPLLGPGAKVGELIQKSRRPDEEKRR